MTIIMNFNVDKLTEILAKNKENHTNIYNKAMEDYRKTTIKEHLETIEKVKESIDLENERHDDAIKRFKTRLKDLKADIKRCESGKTPQLYTIATKPEHRKEEYKNVITMLEMTTDEKIELDNDQFSCYVQDKWIWQKEFLSNATQLYCSGSLTYNPLTSDEDHFMPLNDSASNNYMLRLYNSDDDK